MDYIKEIDNLLKEQQEYLNELFVANGSKNGKGKKYEINVEPDRGSRYSTLPYFKFSESPITKAKEISRIPILPDKDGNYFYQIHSNGIGKHFVLNSEQLNILDKMLRQPPQNPIYKTTWELLLSLANQIIMAEDSNANDKKLIPMSIDIPDYKNLLREK